RLGGRFGGRCRVLNSSHDGADSIGAPRVIVSSDFDAKSLGAGIVDFGASGAGRANGTKEFPCSGKRGSPRALHGRITVHRGERYADGKGIGINGLDREGGVVGILSGSGNGNGVARGEPVAGADDSSWL